MRSEGQRTDHVLPSLAGVSSPREGPEWLSHGLPMLVRQECLLKVGSSKTSTLAHGEIDRENSILNRSERRLRVPRDQKSKRVGPVVIPRFSGWTFG